MAAVIQVIEDGFRNYIIKVQGSTDDTIATIVDVSALDPPCTRVRLRKISYNLASDSSLVLAWDATTDVTLLTLHGSNDADMCFEATAGIPNDAGAGVTGDVVLTGGDASAGTPYTLYAEFIKSDPITH